MTIPTIEEMNALFSSINASLSDEGFDRITEHAIAMGEVIGQCDSAQSTMALSFYLAVATMDPGRLAGLIAIGFQLGQAYATSKQLEDLTK